MNGSQPRPVAISSYSPCSGAAPGPLARLHPDSDAPQSLPPRTAIRDLVRAGRESVTPGDVSKFYADERAMFGSRSEQQVSADIREILRAIA